MAKYTVKRLLYSALILFFVMFLIYVLMYNMPMGYIETKARELASRPGASKSYSEWLADLNAQYGMDKGIVQGYFTWLKSAVRGEWGESWSWTVPVTQKFHDTVWYSFALGLVSFILEILIAIPLGIAAARKQYSFTDYFTTVVSMICISMPTFFLATILKYVFSVKLGWFELTGMQGRNYQYLSDFGKFLDVAKHFVLPAITITIISIGGLMRYTRTNMLEVLNADYIRTARAKGVPEKAVINKHAFRNTLIPRRQSAQPLLRRTHHRDAVRHPRHRLCLLLFDDTGGYTLYHVLFGIHFNSHAARQPHFGPSVCRC